MAGPTDSTEPDHVSRRPSPPSALARADPRRMRRVGGYRRSARRRRAGCRARARAKPAAGLRRHGGERVAAQGRAAGRERVHHLAVRRRRRLEPCARRLRAERHRRRSRRSDARRRGPPSPAHRRRSAVVRCADPGRLAARALRRGTDRDGAYAVTRRAPAAASARRRAARAARSADPFGAHYDHGRVTRIDRRPRGDRLPTREIDPVYTEFFGLNEKPFSITPDPRYLYLSRRHADALAHLIYGISESGGFIQLTGEVGTGKTTLIRSVLEQLP